MNEINEITEDDDENEEELSIKREKDQLEFIIEKLRR